MTWRYTASGTPVNDLGLVRSDPLYKVGHVVYLNNGNGICEFTVKRTWYWLCESSAFIRRRVYNAAMRNSGCGVDPALADPVLRELGEQIGDQAKIGFYELLENDAKVPWFVLDPSWQGAGKYPPVYDAAADWPTTPQDAAVTPWQ